MLCCKEGCQNEATHEVIFILRVDDKHQPALSTPFLRPCKDHCDVEWKDVVTEQSWAGIQRNFTNQGLQAPTTKYSMIEIREIKRA